MYVLYGNFTKKKKVHDLTPNETKTMCSTGEMNLDIEGYFNDKKLKNIKTS